MENRKIEVDVELIDRLSATIGILFGMVKRNIKDATDEDVKDLNAVKELMEQANELFGKNAEEVTELPKFSKN